MTKLMIMETAMFFFAAHQILGFNIGFLANCILKLKHEAAPIFCAQHNDSVSCLSISGITSVAAIFRSNETLMEYAIQGKPLITCGSS